MTKTSKIPQNFGNHKVRHDNYFCEMIISSPGQRTLAYENFQLTSMFISTSNYLSYCHLYFQLVSKNES